MTDERLPPPPVEPLPDLTWARLERQLWATLDAPVVVAPPSPRARWRWPVAAAVSVAAAAAVALAWPARPGDGAELTSRAPTTMPSRVATAAAETELSVGDASIRLAPFSALYLHGGDRGVGMILDRGQASFEVAPRMGRPPFVVDAGAVRVTVVGTGFTVTRLGDGAIVDVRHGVVEVLADGRRALVRAGESWDAEGVHPTATDGAASATAATAPTATDPTATDPTPTIVAAPTAPRSPRPIEPPAPAFDGKAAYAAAAALEASDPAAALTAYQALAARRGPWAANGLYAAARLAFERGDHGRARTLAQRYLRAYPQGSNATDAHTLLERLPH
ncbi:MAG: FecR domain-containing protein [Kofleriaceae bacterium]|nr:FecR domain-containing protein [Kofleriaceae bacterium]MBP9166945.1 FecR domain-containing protein [Kofleriaceae bacterium]MBP9862447.1 FecR domain-containing protein [Kofleriaceae bacterium]